mmetsp:Transcript_10707/g.19396  ORF Transcript_10707/g.19396 Transcript_10707/m.19396 type:complete len:473 (-) Transcript_10707:700-2118(-)
MIVSPTSTLHVATLLFILHPVSSYHAVSFRHASSTITSRPRHFSFSSTRLFSNIKVDVDNDIIDHATLSVGDIWEDHYYTSQPAGSDDDDDDDERQYRSPSHSYVSHLVRAMNVNELDAFLLEQRQGGQSFLNASSREGTNDSTHQKNEKRERPPDTYIDEPYRHLRLLRRRLPDPLWSQIRLEAEHALVLEPDAGPQLYQFVLRQPSLMDALASIISHEIETELMPATALQALVLDQLRLSDDKNIHLDVAASVNRSPSEDSTALNAMLFHQGLHALVCYRVAHRLWQAGRTGLAYYMQSTVSSRYSADIHPAAEIEGGIYLSVGGGVVIGETARVGQGVTILQGVTLGGTGKEVGDRHPKVEDGVILHCGATVLGNLRVGRGAVVTAKSIVTKEVPDLARVSGIPATVKSFRKLREEGFKDDDGDLDCRMRKLYEGYLVELEALVEMELCIDLGKNDCRNIGAELLNSDS